MTYTVDQIRQKVGLDPVWAERALVALLSQQTADEQESRDTKWRNAKGFNAVDASILTSFAQQVQAGRKLSVKQLTIAYRLLPKYAQQLHTIAYGGENNGD